ncbi:Uncharacterised protein [Niallia circulans]|nr:hypothetical protein [Niallia circulans]MED3840945.1 hypothetical protein [Niallia circulans]MED4245898.1 hypothetical protein [Niallia circulans]MED4247728.1 hypothetical protein [Niallia circulans]MED5100912.1 hypothetical protein [Niallia circulans]SPT84397.1 Uncharacterised protein [Niallia circulans]
MNVNSRGNWNSGVHKGDEAKRSGGTRESGVHKRDESLNQPRQS